MDSKVSQKIYNQYLEAFEKGVCDFVKIEKDLGTDKNIPRKYFSGGIECVTPGDIEYKSNLSGRAPRWVASSDLQKVDLSLKPIFDDNIVSKNISSSNILTSTFLGFKASEYSPEERKRISKEIRLKVQEMFGDDFYGWIERNKKEKGSQEKIEEVAISLAGNPDFIKSSRKAESVNSEIIRYAVRNKIFLGTSVRFRDFLAEIKKHLSEDLKSKVLSVSVNFEDYAYFMSALNHPEIIKIVDSEDFRNLDEHYRLTALLIRMKEFGASFSDETRLNNYFRILPDKVTGKISKDYFISHAITVKDVVMIKKDVEDNSQMQDFLRELRYQGVVEDKQLDMVLQKARDLKLEIGNQEINIHRKRFINEILRKFPSEDFQLKKNMIDMFGENVHQWTRRHKTTKKRGDATRDVIKSLIEDKEFQNILLDREKDVLFEMISYFIANDIDLYASGIRDFMEKLYEELPESLIKYLPGKEAKYVKFSDFVYIRASLEHPDIKNFFKSKEYQEEMKPFRLLAFIKKIRQLAPLQSYSLPAIYNALPNILDSKIFKERDIFSNDFSFDFVNLVYSILKIKKISEEFKTLRFRLLNRSQKAHALKNKLLKESFLLRKMEFSGKHDTFFTQAVEYLNVDHSEISDLIVKNFGLKSNVWLQNHKNESAKEDSKEIDKAIDSILRDAEFKKSLNDPEEEISTWFLKTAIKNDISLGTSNLQTALRSLKKKVSKDVAQRIRLPLISCSDYMHLIAGLQHRSVLKYLRSKKFLEAPETHRLTFLFSKVVEVSSVNTVDLHHIFQALPSKISPYLTRDKIFSNPITLKAAQNVIETFEDQAIQNFIKSKKFLLMDSDEKIQEIISMAIRNSLPLSDVDITPAIKNFIYRIINRGNLEKISISDLIDSAFESAGIFEWMKKQKIVNMSKSKLLKKCENAWKDESFIDMFSEDSQHSHALEIIQYFFKKSINLGTPSLSIFLDLLRKSAPEELREKIKDFHITLLDYATVIAFVDDIGTQKEIDSKEFQSIPPYLKIIRLVDMARNNGYAIKTDRLSSIYQALPERLSAKTFKNQLLMIYLSLDEAYEIMKDLRSKEMRKYFSSKRISTRKNINRDVDLLIKKARRQEYMWAKEKVGYGQRAFLKKILLYLGKHGYGAAVGFSKKEILSQDIDDSISLNGKARVSLGSAESGFNAMSFDNIARVVNTVVDETEKWIIKNKAKNNKKEVHEDSQLKVLLAYDQDDFTQKTASYIFSVLNAEGINTNIVLDNDDEDRFLIEQTKEEFLSKYNFGISVRMSRLSPYAWMRFFFNGEPLPEDLKQEIDQRLQRQGSKQKYFHDISLLNAWKHYAIEKNDLEIAASPVLNNKNQNTAKASSIIKSRPWLSNSRFKNPKRVDELKEIRRERFRWEATRKRAEERRSALKKRLGQKAYEEIIDQEYKKIFHEVGNYRAVLCNLLKELLPDLKDWEHFDDINNFVDQSLDEFEFARTCSEQKDATRKAYLKKLSTDLILIQTKMISLDREKRNLENYPILLSGFRQFRELLSVAEEDDFSFSDVHLQMANLNSVIENSYHQKQRETIDISINFSFEIEDIPLDAFRFSHVIINLIKNAKESIGQTDGLISIKTEKDGDFAKITVSDTGPGIDSEMFPKLFKFEATYGKVDGHGIGLNLCKKIVEAHGGTIKGENIIGSTIEEPLGARFVIHLPLKSSSVVIASSGIKLKIEPESLGLTLEKVNSLIEFDRSVLSEIDRMKFRAQINSRLQDIYNSNLEDRYPIIRLTDYMGPIELKDGIVPSGLLFPDFVKRSDVKRIGFGIRGFDEIFLVVEKDSLTKKVKTLHFFGYRRTDDESALFSCIAYKKFLEQEDGSWDKEKTEKELEKKEIENKIKLAYDPRNKKVFNDIDISSYVGPRGREHGALPSGFPLSDGQFAKDIEGFKPEEMLSLHIGRGLSKIIYRVMKNRETGESEQYEFIGYQEKKNKGGKVQNLVSGKRLIIKVDGKWKLKFDEKVIQSKNDRTRIMEKIQRIYKSPRKILFNLKKIFGKSHSKRGSFAEDFIFPDGTKPQRGQPVGYGTDIKSPQVLVEPAMDGLFLTFSAYKKLKKPRDGNNFKISSIKYFFRNEVTVTRQKEFERNGIIFSKDFEYFFAAKEMNLKNIGRLAQSIAGNFRAKIKTNSEFSIKPNKKVKALVFYNGRGEHKNSAEYLSETLEQYGVTSVIQQTSDASGKDMAEQTLSKFDVGIFVIALNGSGSFCAIKIFSDGKPVDERLAREIQQQANDVIAYSKRGDYVFVSEEKLPDRFVGHEKYIFKKDGDQALWIENGTDEDDEGLLDLLDEDDDLRKDAAAESTNEALEQEEKEFLAAAEEKVLVLKKNPVRISPRALIENLEIENMVGKRGVKKLIDLSKGFWKSRIFDFEEETIRSDQNINPELKSEIIKFKQVADRAEWDVELRTISSLDEKEKDILGISAFRVSSLPISISADNSVEFFYHLNSDERSSKKVYILSALLFDKKYENDPKLQKQFLEKTIERAFEDIKRRSLSNAIVINFKGFSALSNVESAEELLKEQGFEFYDVKVGENSSAKTIRFAVLSKGQREDESLPVVSSVITASSNMGISKLKVDPEFLGLTSEKVNSLIESDRSVLSEIGRMAFRAQINSRLQDIYNSNLEDRYPIIRLTDYMSPSECRDGIVPLGFLFPNLVKRSSEKRIGFGAEGFDEIFVVAEKDFLAKKVNALHFFGYQHSENGDALSCIAYRKFIEQEDGSWDREKTEKELRKQEIENEIKAAYSLSNKKEIVHIDISDYVGPTGLWEGALPSGFILSDGQKIKDMPEFKPRKMLSLHVGGRLSKLIYRVTKNRETGEPEKYEFMGFKQKKNRLGRIQGVMAGKRSIVKISGKWQLKSDEESFQFEKDQERIMGEIQKTYKSPKKILFKAKEKVLARERDPIRISPKALFENRESRNDIVIKEKKASSWMTSDFAKQEDKIWDIERSLEESLENNDQEAFYAAKEEFEEVSGGEVIVFSNSAEAQFKNVDVISRDDLEKRIEEILDVFPKTVPYNRFLTKKMLIALQVSSGYVRDNVVSVITVCKIRGGKALRINGIGLKERQFFFSFLLSGGSGFVPPMRGLSSLIPLYEDIRGKQEEDQPSDVVENLGGYIGGSGNAIERIVLPNGKFAIRKTAYKNSEVDGGKLRGEVKVIKEEKARGKPYPEIYSYEEDDKRIVVVMEDLEYQGYFPVTSISHWNSINLLENTLEGVSAEDIWKLGLRVYQDQLDLYQQKVSEGSVDFVIENILEKKLSTRLEDTKDQAPCLVEMIDAPIIGVSGETSSVTYLPGFETLKPFVSALAKVGFFVPPYLSKDHGDLNYGNILVKMLDIPYYGEFRDYRLIDPKDSPGGNDYLYDLAKLVHNFLGKYDVARLEPVYGFYPLARQDSEVPHFYEYLDDEYANPVPFITYDRMVQEFYRWMEQTDDLFGLEQGGKWKLRLIFTVGAMMVGLPPFHLKNNDQEPRARTFYITGVQLMYSVVSLLMNDRRIRRLADKEVPGIAKAWKNLEKEIKDLKKTSDKKEKKASSWIGANSVSPDFVHVKKKRVKKEKVSESRDDEGDGSGDIFFLPGSPDIVVSTKLDPEKSIFGKKQEASIDDNKERKSASSDLLAGNGGQGRFYDSLDLDMEKPQKGFVYMGDDEVFPKAVRDFLGKRKVLVMENIFDKEEDLQTLSLSPKEIKNPISLRIFVVRSVDDQENEHPLCNVFVLDASDKDAPMLAYSSMDFDVENRFYECKWRERTASYKISRQGFNLRSVVLLLSKGDIKEYRSDSVGGLQHDGANDIFLSLKKDSRFKVSADHGYTVKYVDHQEFFEDFQFSAKPIVKDILDRALNPSLLAAEMIQKGILTKGQKILSLGSGSGADEIYFAENEMEVVATDKNSEIIKSLRRSSKGVSNIKVEVVDFEKYLPYLNNSFDAVYFRLGLHYLGDSIQGRLLLEINRILKKGGKVIIQTKSVNDVFFVEGDTYLGIDGMYFFKNKGYSRNHSSGGKLIKLIQKNGFKILRDITEGKEKLYQDNHESTVLTIVAQKENDFAVVSASDQDKSISLSFRKKIPTPQRGKNTSSSVLDPAMWAVSQDDFLNIMAAANASKKLYERGIQLKWSETQISPWLFADVYKDSKCIGALEVLPENSGNLKVFSIFLSIQRQGIGPAIFIALNEALGAHNGKVVEKISGVSDAIHEPGYKGAPIYKSEEMMNKLVIRGLAESFIDENEQLAYRMLPAILENKNSQVAAAEGDVDRVQTVNSVAVNFAQDVTGASSELGDGKINMDSKRFEDPKVYFNKITFDANKKLQEIGRSVLSLDGLKLEVVEPEIIKGNNAKIIIKNKNNHEIGSFSLFYESFFDLSIDYMSVSPERKKIGRNIYIAINDALSVNDQGVVVSYGNFLRQIDKKNPKKRVYPAEKLWESLIRDGLAELTEEHVCKMLPVKSASSVVRNEVADKAQKNSDELKKQLAEQLKKALNKRSFSWPVDAGDKEKGIVQVSFYGQGNSFSVMLDNPSEILTENQKEELNLKPEDKYYPAVGSLGQIGVMIEHVDDKPCIYINEVQASAGVLQIGAKVLKETKIKSPFRAWSQEAVKQVVKVAKDLGIKDIYFKSPSQAKENSFFLVGPWALDSKSLKEYYVRPLKWIPEELKTTETWRSFVNGCVHFSVDSVSDLLDDSQVRDSFLSAVNPAQDENNSTISQRAGSSVFLTEKKIDAFRKILQKEPYGRYGRMRYFEERILPELRDIFSGDSSSKRILVAIEKRLTELAQKNFYKFDWLIYELFEEKSNLRNASKEEVQSLMKSILDRTPDSSHEQECYGPKYYGEDKNDDLYIWFSRSTHEAINQLEKIEYSWEEKEVLEIAPGQDGEFLRWVKKQGAHVMAADRSFRGTRFARQKHNVKAKRADLLDLSVLKDKKFDVIFAASVLNYILKNDASGESKQKVGQVIESLKSVLAPGGILCFAFSNREEMDMRVYDNRMPDYIIESFTQAGFKIVSNYKKGEVLVFEDTVSARATGGIDFDRNNWDLETEGDSIEFEMPVELQGIDFDTIQGFIPVIINIVPIVNVLLVLGLSEKDTKNLKWAQDLQKADRPRELSLLKD